MSSRFRRLGPAVLLMLPFTALMLAFPDGPFPRLTGGFSEDTCRNCHDSFQLNEGRSLGGSFEIQGVPRDYEAGREYALKVVLSHPGQKRWGFELSSRFAGGGEQAGTLRPVDELTQVKRARGIEFIEHTEAGTRNGTTDGPVEFEFSWTAPDPSMGPVLFNAAGNAANGDDTSEGDYIYTAGAYSAGGAAAPADLVASSEVARQPRRISEDSRVAHLAAPVDLNRGNVEFLIQHRFLGPFIGRDGAPDAGTAFGVDFGANINLDVNYALTDRLSVEASRARFDRLVALAGTYEIQTDPESFWKLSVRGGVEGQNNFQEHYSPFLEIPASFDYRFFRAQVTPIFAFNSRPDRQTEQRINEAVNPDSNHTFALGFGTDLALNRRFSLVGEWVPRISGFGGFGGDRSAISGGLKIRTWGHVFHVLLSTSRVFTPGQYGVNATSTDYALGFNIYRKMGR